MLISASASAVPVAPLPVSLTVFATKVSRADVRLSWAMASELTNYDVSLISAVGSTVVRFTAQSGQSQVLTLPATLASARLAPGKPAIAATLLQKRASPQGLALFCA